MSIKTLVFGPTIAIIVITLFRAIFVFKPQPKPQSCLERQGHERIKLDQDMLNRFFGALNIPTISYKPGQYEPEQLLKLIDYIEQSFPQIHGSPFVRRERVANFTLLYTVEGSDKSLEPYMLTSHMDVVPAVRENWSSDPFKAVLKEDKHIYARGTIDAKDLLVSMLEALEFMLRKGFKPRRTIYLVFGHDEEIRGSGAQAVAELLQQRLRANDWKSLLYVLDEGLMVAKDRFPGVDSDIALVGVVEKGYVTVKLSSVGSVGHGSMPPPRTAISKLASAVAKFHAHMMPSFFGEGIERDMIETFASHAKWPYKLAYANFWLFKPIFSYIFDSSPQLNSLIRTSTAVTIIEGGTKENVLPDSASAYVNHRIHSRQSIADVMELDRRIVDDPTITVEITEPSNEPTPVAPYCDDCYAYQLLKHTILQIYPDSLVVPGTFLAASDSRWYTNLTQAIYKFSAISVPLEEMKRFHGNDERISAENYENLVNFYHHLIENSDSAKLHLQPSQRTEL